MGTRRRSDREIMAEIPAAVARGRRMRRSRPHALAARYDSGLRSLTISLANGGALVVPISLVPELRRASAEQLAQVEVGPAGLGLHWDHLDVDLSVAGLARILLGSQTLLSAAGSAGGAARTKAKAVAARQNGRKGGRPKTSR